MFVDQMPMSCSKDSHHDNDHYNHHYDHHYDHSQVDNVDYKHDHHYMNIVDDTNIFKLGDVFFLVAFHDHYLHKIPIQDSVNLGLCTTWFCPVRNGYP